MTTTRWMPTSGRGYQLGEQRRGRPARFPGAGRSCCIREARSVSAAWLQRMFAGCGCTQRTSDGICRYYQSRNTDLTCESLGLFYVDGAS